MKPQEAGGHGGNGIMTPKLRKGLLVALLTLLALGVVLWGVSKVFSGPTRWSGQTTGPLK